MTDDRYMKATSQYVYLLYQRLLKFTRKMGFDSRNIIESNFKYSQNI